MNNEVMKKYGDIIYLSPRRSETRARMTNRDRAAQFSPFAALTGHAESIKETARYTDEYWEPSEETRAKLDERMALLLCRLSDKPEISVTYFKPDEKKNGGEYVTVTGVVDRVKPIERQIRLASGKVIAMDYVTGLSGKLFEGMDE